MYCSIAHTDIFLNKATYCNSGVGALHQVNGLPGFEAQDRGLGIENEIDGSENRNGLFGNGLRS